MERLLKFNDGDPLEVEGEAEHEEESQEATEKEATLEILLGDISSVLSTHTPERELESFEKEVAGTKTDPITWWQERYPLLSRLAKQFYVFQQCPFHPKDDH